MLLRTIQKISSPLQSNHAWFTEELGMAYDKRYVAQKRQRRRRKTAKAKLKLYEQGKISHDKLPSLSKRFLSRKARALKRAE